MDQLIVGGIANTFLLAEGKAIENLAEAELVGEAQRSSPRSKAHGGAVPLPNDVVVAIGILGKPPTTHQEAGQQK